MKKELKTELLTGIRPTGNLTIANYLGAVEPLIKLQKQGLRPLVFVADLHALTDREPMDIKSNIKEVVADYIALGINPDQADIYLQSDIAGETSFLTALLARLISVSELLRVPTLKDKLKQTDRPEIANTLLLLYPVLMSADILLNQAQKVPVGEDQQSHMEVCRMLAKKFNKKYGKTFTVPSVLQVKSLRILSLKGKGKMSKTNPSGAIFLTDTPETVAKKVKSAETAEAGTMNERLESLIQIGLGLSVSQVEVDEINSLIESHMNGDLVMGQFKKILLEIIQNFLAGFQARRKKVTDDPLYIESVLKRGAIVAKRNAEITLANTLTAMKF